MDRVILRFSLPRLLLPLLAGAAALAATAPPAHATIVERVVAVIGERPVLWTELLSRAKASRIQIRTQTQNANVVTVQEQELYKELLDRMIDDRLEEQQADRAHLNVTPDEIDRGIQNIAAQAAQAQGHPVTVAMVIDEVHRRGLSEQDFRDEIRRQILEGKLIELRVRPRVRVTEQDARAAYQHYVQQVAEQHPVDVQLLVKRVLPGSLAADVQAQETLMQTLATEAQSGRADFCELVKQHSDDASTRPTCGSHGPQPLSQLFPAIQTVVRTQAPGTVSNPFHVHIGPDDVLVIARPLGSPQTPAYEQVKNEMMQNALLEGIERARKQWLEELRHNVYIDVRL